MIFEEHWFQMRLLTKQDLDLIYQNAANKKESYFLIVNVLAKTGVRVSELISITPNDILFEEKQIIIRGKGNKIRNIDVSNDLIYLLRIYINKNKIKKKDQIFPLSRQQIGNITRALGWINPHTFRHSYAIELLRKTKNIRYVQVQLGHSTLKTTEIYLRFMEYKLEKQKLGELWK